ncbi:MAG: DNA polymerase III subunit delta' [Gammaproteobacteria bacterium 28-57-27]|nr:MAG: DNA polymerase III subunit delta' [Gammaproteobacteria bacterium 28-57-27]
MHSPLYPWLHAEFARFHALRSQGRMPHALLISGEPGLGQGQLAMRLAQATLCHRPLDDGQACGQCAACRPFLAGAHPDFSLLTPKEKDSKDDEASKDKKDNKAKDIKVDAVREFCAGLYLSSSFQHGKVGVIEPADVMNAAAANSLLKTLEEPPAGTLIILVTSQPARLPITIRSRCQRWQVGIPERVTALAWLARQPQLAGEDPVRLLDLAEGRPLTALALAEPERLARRGRWLESVLHVLRAGGNPLSLAASQDKAEWPTLLHWSRLLLVDLIRLHGAGQVDQAVKINLVNRDYADVLAPLAARLHARELFGLYDYLLESSRLVDHPLNRELLIEELLIRFQRLGGHA